MKVNSKDTKDAEMLGFVDPLGIGRGVEKEQHRKSQTSLPKYYILFNVFLFSIENCKDVCYLTLQLDLNSTHSALESRQK